MVKTRSQRAAAAVVEEPAADGDGAFAKHAQQDQALQQPPDGANDADKAASTGLAWPGRLMVFVAFPITAGTIGLYIAYLDSIKHPDKKISLDQDFVMPFLLALAMAAVLFYQTGGFSSTQVKPLVPWPKVRRVKKIIRKKKGEAEADKVDFDSSNKKDD